MNVSENLAIVSWKLQRPGETNGWKKSHIDWGLIWLSKRQNTIRIAQEKFS